MALDNTSGKIGEDTTAAQAHGRAKALGRDRPSIGYRAGRAADLEHDTAVCTVDRRASPVVHGARRSLDPDAIAEVAAVDGAHVDDATTSLEFDSISGIAGSDRALIGQGPGVSGGAKRSK